ncbi:MAG: 4Fe-4S binding protein [Syntrophaceae bacterium]
MNTDTATLIFFSPTGTTRKILKAIIEGSQGTMVNEIDLTLPAATETRNFMIKPDGFTIIGVPVYGGRVPVTAAQRLKRLKADKIPAAIVVVYGNRAYEDALLELSALVREVGFIPVAAGAFIGEHSYSTTTTPIAVGRPDALDLIQARDFGAMIREKLARMQSLDADAPLPLPGDFPYKDHGAWPEMSPTIREDLCNLCGACAAVCPTGAITVDMTVLTDKKQCINCCACVKICPLGARVMEEPLIKEIAQWLSATFKKRTEPEMFV